ncbi:hypothetical protein ABZ698_16875 [Streptomyces antibioticus]
MEAVELAADLRPGVTGGGLGDPDQQEGEPAQDDVGADAFFEAVVDGPQVDDLFMSRQPRSRSNLRRKHDHALSARSASAPVCDHHSHRGFGLPPEGRRSTSRRITVPGRMGSSGSG